MRGVRVTRRPSRRPNASRKGPRLIPRRRASSASERRSPGWNSPDVIAATTMSSASELSEAPIIGCMVLILAPHRRHVVCPTRFYRRQLFTVISVMHQVVMYKLRFGKLKNAQRVVSHDFPFGMFAEVEVINLLYGTL